MQRGAGRAALGEHPDQQGGVGGGEAGGGLVQQLLGLGEGAASVESGDPLGEGAEVGPGGRRRWWRWSLVGVWPVGVWLGVWLGVWPQVWRLGVWWLRGVRLGVRPLSEVELQLL
ncbi:hypothetical protein BG452_07840 [Streptomyces sp. CBMA123]|nr:hypothetical protein [Streptomyces sp. CBMA123]